MECHVINMEQAPRREQYAYFRTFANPYVGLTVNVDITGLMPGKARGESLFLLTLYAVSRAANSVPELRRRMREQEVVEYSWCPTSHTVALDNGAYCYCRLSADMPLEDFLPYAQAAQMRAKQAPSLDDGEDGESLFFISCVPWVTYTAMVQPVPIPADSNPRITWGKYFCQKDRTLLPVTLLAHHALVDGIHIAQFYEALDRELAAIAAEEA